MTVQTHTTGTISVFREALAREGMRYTDSSVSRDVSPATYLRIADNAVESHRQARAHLALYRTEAALLANASPDDSAAVTIVRDARRAVGAGDYAKASSLIQMALGAEGS